MENVIDAAEESLEKNKTPTDPEGDEPAIVEDICVEELAIDGICGVY